MTASIFIVTFAHDGDWVPYLLKSITKNCSDFTETVILVPDRDRAFFERFGLTKERLVTFSEEGFVSGFNAHQNAECEADLYCTGDIIIHLDSDCHVIAPTTPDTYVTEDGKCVNLCTRYDSLNKDRLNSPWQACTERFLGRKVEVETMRRHAACYPRELYPAARAHVENVHHRTLRQMLAPMPRHAPAPESFSEYNFLGAFGYYFMPDRLHFIDTDRDPVPVNTVFQQWSHHRPTNPDVQKKLSEFGLL